MHKPFLIGVAGGTGSGKSTVVAKLKEVFIPKVISISHDNYYRDQSDKPMSERILTNYDHPLSLETKLLVQHLGELIEGKTTSIPTYDFVHHTRSDKTLTIEPKSVILVEGILLFESKALRDLLSLKIFVDTDADIRFIRRLTRDIAERGRDLNSVVEQYLTTVKPMHDEFVEPSKRYADIIIPEGGKNEPAIDVLIARIKELVVAEEKEYL